MENNTFKREESSIQNATLRSPSFVRQIILPNLSFWNFRMWKSKKRQVCTGFKKQLLGKARSMHTRKHLFPMWRRLILFQNFCWTFLNELQIKRSEAWNILIWAWAETKFRVILFPCSARLEFQTTFSSLVFRTIYPTSTSSNPLTFPESYQSLLFAATRILASSTAYPLCLIHTPIFQRIFLSPIPTYFGFSPSLPQLPKMPCFGLCLNQTRFGLDTVVALRWDNL